MGCFGFKMKEKPNNQSLSFKKNGKETSDYDRYKTLFESINAGAFITSIDGEIIEANLKSCYILGYEWEELTGLSFEKIFPKNVDWDQIREEIMSKGGMNFESESKKKDGTVFPVAIDTSLFKLEKKPVMLALIWDITERKNAEEKLRESEQKYRSIFENSAVAIMLTDKDEKIISWNGYAEKIFGMNQADLEYKPVESLYPKEEWEKIRSKNIRKKGMQHLLETRMYKKDGSLFDVDLSVSVLRDENGNITGSVGIIKDISEKKKAEKKLRESEEKYEGLFESTTDGMLVLDARGEIKDINGKALEIFGKNQNEMIGENFLSMGLLTPKALSIVVKQFQDLLSNKKSESKETEIISKEDKNLNVELTSFFLSRKENEVDNFVLIIRDITERKKTEIRLSREHELLQTLMNNMPDPVYFKNIENKFLMVNKAMAANNNAKPEDMKGKTDFDYLSPERAQKAFKEDEEVMNTGKFIINKPRKYVREDGVESWVSITKIPRFDEEGSIIGMMGVKKDITYWKKIEASQNNK